MTRSLLLDISLQLVCESHEKLNHELSQKITDIWKYSEYNILFVS